MQGYSIKSLGYASYTLPRPRAIPVPLAMPLPLTGLRVVVEVVDPRVAVLVVLVLVLECETPDVFPKPVVRTLPLVVPNLPLDVVPVACVLFLSASSAFLAAASLCC